MDKQYHPTQEKKAPNPPTGGTRRLFLRRAAGTGLLTVAGSALLPGLSFAGKGTGIPAPTTASADTTILNYLLLIERLDAQFYNLNASKPYLTAATGGGTTGNAYQVMLVGSEEVPPVNTLATGTASLQLSQDSTQLSYNVQVTGLSGPATSLYLRRGARGLTGDIVYGLALPDATGAASGVVPFNPADASTLLNGGFYLNVSTAANPNGEIRGQILPSTPTNPGSSTSGTLKGIIDEIRDHENAHVAQLTQLLGTNAQAPQTFQNLDAPTLQQFLTLAQTLEDVAASAYLGQLSQIQDKQLLATVSAIAMVEGRHAGGLRAYRKGASTGDGGDPNLTLTEDREALNRARTQAQVQALIQPYTTGTVTNPTPY
jgi:hypothetical protein